LCGEEIPPSTGKKGRRPWFGGVEKKGGRKSGTEKKRRKGRQPNGNRPAGTKAKNRSFLSESGQRKKTSGSKGPRKPSAPVGRN